MSRMRRVGSNTSMCASSSITRSTLARNTPPACPRICAFGEHHRVSIAGSTNALHTRCTSDTISTRWAYPRALSLMMAFCRQTPSGRGRAPPQGSNAHGQQREGHDENGHQPEVLFDHRDVAEQITAPQEEGHPRQATENVEDLEATVGHASHAGHEGGEGPHDRHEARQRDGQPSEAHEELLRAPQVLDFQQTIP